MDHVSNSNFYRKKLPGIFTGDDQADTTSILKEKLKTLTPVPMPLDMKRANDQAGTILKSPRRARASIPLSPINRDIGPIKEANQRGAMSVPRRKGSVGMSP